MKGMLSRSEKDGDVVQLVQPLFSMYEPWI